MKTFLDCIPCFLRQALAAARKSTDDESVQRHVLNSVSYMIPDLALDATPPEIARQVYRIVSEFTGNKDPYVEAKKSANQSAMSLVFEFITIPFDTYWSILPNMVDFI